MEETFQPMEETCQPMEETFQPMEEIETFQPVEVNFQPNQDIATNIEINIIRRKEESKIGETDKSMLTKGQWTCKLRNLQIFPVNQNGSNTKKTFQEKELAQHDDVVCPVDDTELLNENLYEVSDETSSTEASRDVAVETQIPENIISTEKKCSVCGFSTDDEELYNHHQVTDHLLCYICGFSTEYQMFIFSHMKAMHKVLDFEPEEEEVSENINYRFTPQSTACPLCFEKLESKGALKRHRSKVHKGQNFTCKICGKRFFKSFNFLARHYRKDHDKDTDSKTLYDETLVR